MNLTGNNFDLTNITFFQKKFSKRVAILMFKYSNIALTLRPKSDRRSCSEITISVSYERLDKKLNYMVTAGNLFSNKYSEGDVRLLTFLIPISERHLFQFWCKQFCLASRAYQKLDKKKCDSRFTLSVLRLVLFTPDL